LVSNVRNGLKHILATAAQLTGKQRWWANSGIWDY